MEGFDIHFWLFFTVFTLFVWLPILLLVCWIIDNYLLQGKYKKKYHLDLNAEKIISIIAWILFQFVALHLVWLIDNTLVSLFCPPKELKYSGGGALSNQTFLIATGSVLTAAAIMIAVVVCVIIARYGYGDKCFWGQCRRWYVVYWLLSLVAFTFQGFSWNTLFVLWYLPSAFIAICLYPVISMLGLMLVMTITRRIKKMIRKEWTGNHNN
jgi:hypothetical protein